MKVQRATLFAVLSAIAICAAIFIGLIFIGSPTEFRLRRFDQSRVNDLASISSAIRTYRLTHEALPQKLDELQRSQAMNYSLRDLAGRPYEYTAKDAFSYELCAEFDTATDNMTATRFTSIFESHGLGRQCYGQEGETTSRTLMRPILKERPIDSYERQMRAEGDDESNQAPKQKGVFEREILRPFEPVLSPILATPVRTKAIATTAHISAPIIGRKAPSFICSLLGISGAPQLRRLDNQ